MAEAEGPEQRSQRHLAELQEAWRRASSGGGVLVLTDPAGRSGARWARRLCSELGLSSPPRVLADSGGRPWGCLGDLAWELALRLRTQHPEVLRRYGSLLVSLRSTAAGEEPLKGFRGHASGVADYLLEGHVAGLRDFFRGRDVSPWLVEDLVAWLLAATRHIASGASAADRFPLWIDCAAPLSASERRGLEALAARLGEVPGGRARRRPLPGLLLTVAAGDEVLPAALQELAASYEGQIWPVPEAEGRMPAGVHRASAATAELPADRCRHQRLGGEQGWGLTGLQAMAHGWRVSDYAAALGHARRAMEDPKVLEKVHPELVLALLCYEAGRFEEADEQFSALLARATKEISRVIIRRLQGYAQIFGLHQFERGLETFELPLQYFTEQERRREVCFLRNSSALALLRLGRFDEAQELEEQTLEEVEGFDPPDSYLLTLIHLNLGRLLRDRDPQAAAEHIAAARDANEGDLSPDLLLIFLLLRAEVAEAQGEQALRARLWAQAEELARDFDPAEVAQRLEPFLRRGSVPQRSDASRPLGETVRRALGAGRRAAESAREDEISSEEAAGIRRAEAEARLGRELEEELRTGSCGDVGLEVSRLVAAGKQDPAKRLAELVVEKGWVGWLRGVEAAGESSEEGRGLVLQDPRSAPARARVRRALRRAPSAGWVLALPTAADFFDGFRSLPGELQIVDVQHGKRRQLSGLEPVDLRVGVLPEASEGGAGDARLRSVLEHFAELTGLPLLAVTALRRAGRWPVEDPRRALRLMLETGMEELVVGDRWVRWAPGEIGRDPWLTLRPKLSTAASIYRNDQEDRDQEGRASGFLTAPGCCAQVGDCGLELLERCRGQRSLERLLEDLDPQARQDVRALLCQLHDRGLVSLL